MVVSSFLTPKNERILFSHGNHPDHITLLQSLAAKYHFNKDDVIVVDNDWISPSNVESPALINPSITIKPISTDKTRTLST